MKNKFIKFTAVIVSMLMVFSTVVMIVPISTVLAADIEDGNYEIKVTALEEASEKESMLDIYIEDTAQLQVENGEVTAYVTVADSVYCQDFKIEIDGEYVVPITAEEDNEDETITYEFEVENIDNRVSCKAFSAPTNSDIEFSLLFDADSIKNISDEEIEEEIEDGLYEIDVKALQQSSSDESIISVHIKDKAKLKVNSGEIIAYLTVTNIDYWQNFKVKNNEGELVDAELTEEDEMSDTRIYKFEVEDIANPTTAQAYLDPVNADIVFSLVFDEDSIRNISDEEIDEEEIEEEIEDGCYEIEVEVLKESSDEKSMAGDYMNETVELEVEDGEITAYLKVSQASYWSEVKYRNEDGKFEYADIEVEDTEEDVRVYELKEVDIEEPLMMEAYPIPMGWTVRFRLVFDESTLEEIEGLSTDDYEEEEVNVEKDGCYEIEVEVLKESSDEKSMAGDYMDKTVELEIDDGEITAYLKVSPASYWSEVKYRNEDGKFEYADIEVEDTEEDVRIYELKEVDIEEPLMMEAYPIPMGWTVRFRLVFDESTLEEIEGLSTDDYEEEEASVEKDGCYEIEVEVLKESSDEKSMAGDYMDKTVELEVDDGEITAYLKVSPASYWSEVKYRNEDGKFEYADIEVEDTEEDVRIYELNEVDIEEPLMMEAYPIPMGWTVRFRLVFDESTLEEIHSLSIDDYEEEVEEDVFDEADAVVINVVPKTESGKATAIVTSQMIRDVFEETKDKDNVENTIIQIIVEELEEVGSYETIIPASYLSSESYRIKLQTPLGVVLFPSNMIDDNQIDDKNISVTIEAAEKSELNEGLKEKIGDRPVVDIYLSSKGKPILWDDYCSQVQISVPYVPQKEELNKLEHITVWYINQDGNTIPVPSGRYNSKTEMVDFKSNHLSKYAIVSVYKTFDDIENYSWCKDEIEILASKGIMTGISEHLFGPGNNMTRADFIELLIKVLGLSAITDDSFEAFNDVDKLSSQYEYIVTAKKYEFIKGVGKKLFHPEVKLTRQDMLVITERALNNMNFINEHEKASDELKKYKDESEISSYAISSIASLIKDAFVSYEGEMIDPKKNVTRAEVADILYKIYNKVLLH